VIEGEPDAWVISLALLLLSLSKEIWLLLLPLIFQKEMRHGAREAATRTLRVAAPSLVAGVLLRWMWAAQAGTGRAPTDYVAALGSIVASVSIFAPDFLLGGLTILALAALYREEAREYLGQHALTLLPLLALPLFAAAYTGEGAATSFFADDVRRLLIYVLPFVAALAVHLDPEHSASSRFLSKPVAVSRVALGLVVAMMLAPLGLSGYSRIDLSTSRDGPYVLGFVRETLKTARKLERGETVVLDPVERKFAWGVSPPNDLAKLRFFLRSGFGPLAHYGIHDIKMRETTATLIAPTLNTRALKMALTMDAREAAWISVFARGSKVGEALVGPQAVQVTFDIPSSGLFRGDNPIELRCDKAATALPRILRMELTQASAKP
jgi:hypothetical protein